MVTINTVSDTKFSLNGITYGKIYQPLAQGTEHISIVNVYDTNQKLINSTHFSEFNVNGSTYLDQDTLISSLILVIFTIGEGGGSGGGAWGEITGTLSDQGDLQSALDGKANTSHTHTFASITGKPTTLAGYGITNAYTKTESDGRYLQDETYDTPSELLTAIKTVDGTGSGLDADTLDGIDSSRVWYGNNERKTNDGRGLLNSITASGVYFDNNTSPSPNNGPVLHMQYDVGNDIASQLGSTPLGNLWRVRAKNGGVWTGWETLWHSGNDGPGSGLDADTLDGVQLSNIARTDLSETFDAILRVRGELLYIGDSDARTRIRDNNSGSTVISQNAGGVGSGIFLRPDQDVSTVNQVHLTTTSFTRAGFTIWDAGNDGAGSGLDADLLDGFNSSTSGTANTVAVRNGSGQLYATAFFESSDRSLKENIEYLTPDFVKFNFKDSPNQLRYGVIAQEVEKENPELVHTNEEGLKSVNYIDLLVLRIAEMNRSMANLIKEMETLKSQING